MVSHTFVRYPVWYLIKVCPVCLDQNTLWGQEYIKLGLILIALVSNEGLDRVCAYAQYHQSLRFSHTQSKGVEDDSNE